MGSLYRAPKKHERFVLTFDDGPHPNFTPRLLDRLAESRLKAFFFVVGKQVALPGGREIVARAYREGHRIGSHTYTHRDLTTLSASEVHDEIVRTEDLVGEFLTSRKLLRPPYGAHNPSVDRLVRDHGYQIVLWDVDSQDWKAEDQPTNWMEIVAEEIADRRHSTVIFHDNHSLFIDNFAAFLGKVNAIPDVRLIPFSLRRLRPARIRRRFIRAIRSLRADL